MPRLTQAIFSAPALRTLSLSLSREPEGHVLTINSLVDLPRFTQLHSLDLQLGRFKGRLQSTTLGSLRALTHLGIRAWVDEYTEPVMVSWRGSEAAPGPLLRSLLLLGVFVEPADFVPERLERLETLTLGEGSAKDSRDGDDHTLANSLPQLQALTSVRLYGFGIEDGNMGLLGGTFRCLLPPLLRCGQLRELSVHGALLSSDAPPASGLQLTRLVLDEVNYDDLEGSEGELPASWCSLPALRSLVLKG